MPLGAAGSKRGVRRTRESRRVESCTIVWRSWAEEGWKKGVNERMAGHKLTAWSSGRVGWRRGGRWVQTEEWQEGH